jgi:hypothetical protein
LPLIASTCRGWPPSSGKEEEEDPTAGDDIDAPVLKKPSDALPGSAVGNWPEWSETEVKDHAAVLPTLLRYFHGLMVDYHASFHGSGIELNREILREIVATYFEMHAIAVRFERPARFPAAACLITSAELQRMRDETRAEADEASRYASRARHKLDETEGWIDQKAAADRAQAIVSRQPEWVHSQPELEAVLRQAFLTPDALEFADAADAAAAMTAAAVTATANTPATAPPVVSVRARASDPERCPERLTATSYLTAVDAPATAPAGEPSAVPGAAPGTGDERMLRYESLVHEGADALLEAQASELKRRGMHLNEKTSEFGAAMRMFEGAYALLPQASTLVSVANMAFKLGQVMTSLT